ncbi:MAG: ATP-binding protein [Clostridia bacterium]|nr:ATP-binding protein [Clostridia bacterium]
MRNKIYKIILNELQTLRKQEELYAQKKSDIAFAIPELKECDKAIRLNNFEMVKAEFEGKDTSAFKQNEIELSSMLNKSLLKYGYNYLDFEPQYTCPKCNDTGKIGNTYCECFNSRYLAKVKSIANLEVVAPFTFKDFDASKIFDISQFNFLEETYKKAKIYCKMFSPKKTQNMLLAGPAGTGKTCVASAIANELVNRGFTVIFISSYELFQKMKSCHFSLPEDRDQYLEDFLTVDLLIIDDLGVEPYLNNITEEYLLLIICEREVNCKSTIVTTNLSDQLVEKYGERIAYRLTNQRNTLIRIFEGNDLRSYR